MTAPAPTPSSITITVPYLTTPRLLLREYRVADFEAFAKNLADPEVTKFMTPVADKRAAWRAFSSASGQWVLQGKGWWAAELRDSGVVVGSVGAFIRETGPDLELGWSVYRPFWGQGFATEAAKAALDFALTEYGSKRVIAHIEARNKASVSVSQKLGMKYEMEVDFYEERLGRYVLEV